MRLKAFIRTTSCFAVIIFNLLFCLTAQAKIAQVQQVLPVTGGSLCAWNTGTSCAVTVAPTGSGHILIAMFGGSTPSAVSDGINTWMHAPNCAIGNVDCWYVLSSKPGATSIKGTVPSGGGRGVGFYEFSVGAGCSAVLDSSNSVTDSTASLSQPGIPLTLKGSNDVIVQQIFAGPTIVSINNGYTEGTGQTDLAVASSLNTTSGVAPVWTLASSATANVDAIAISESCPVSISVNPLQTTLYASQRQQFVATVAGSANTAVNWSVNPPVGSISSNGLYIAPASLTAAQTVTLTATSAANPSQSASATVSVPAGSVLATFSLSELFGVAWPDQPIEFRYDGGQPPVATTRMIGPLGAEVPYQWVSSCSDPTAVKGCIAVRSNLPANSNYIWTLISGTTPAATAVNPVQFESGG